MRDFHTLTHHHQTHETTEPLPHGPTNSHVPTKPATNNNAQASVSPQPSQRPHHMRTRSMDGIFKPKTLIVTKHSLPKAIQCTLELREPTCYSQAIKLVEWREAMALEFDALQRQGTWTLVPLLPGKKVVGCCWVCKVKQRSNGTIEMHKARLVAKGFHQ